MMRLHLTRIGCDSHRMGVTQHDVCQHLKTSDHQRSFRGGTRGNAVPIVEVFKDVLWTALRTIFRPKRH